MPKSYAATRKTRPRDPSAGPTTSRASYGSRVDTPFARSAPSMPGDRRTRSPSDAGSRSSVEIAHRMAPALRMRRVSRRVSMPSIPTTPAAPSSSCRDRSLRHDDGRRDASRTTNPATWIPRDSGSSEFTP